jgi:hypothetical protein
MSNGTEKTEKEKGITVEKVRLEGVTIRDVLKEDFIKAIGQEYSPALLLLINKEGKMMTILSHQNPEELVKKIIHVESQDPKVVERLSKFLEKK